MGVDPNQGASASASAAASSSSSTTVPTANPQGHKRKLDQQELSDANEHNDHELDKLSASKKHKATQDAHQEKRLRKFRPKAPTNFAAIYERATTQRFFVLSRTLRGTPECPEMFLQISGSTGNVYNVCIARQPTCDCPHARGGNQCKHTLFALKKVLRAKYEYVYQLALLSSELREIFAAAPSPDRNGNSGDKDKDNGRRPIDGDCPICFEEMHSDPGKEALVWCKAACGQNIHEQCFNMWAASIKRQSGGLDTSKVTCPYCRSDWETVNVADITEGKLTSEGYVNVADQLGISEQRDYSSYNRFWPGFGRRGHYRRFGR